VVWPGPSRPVLRCWDVQLYATACAIAVCHASSRCQGLQQCAGQRAVQRCWQLRTQDIQRLAQEHVFEELSLMVVRQPANGNLQRKRIAVAPCAQAHPLRETASDSPMKSANCTMADEMFSATVSSPAAPFEYGQRIDHAPQGGRTQVNRQHARVHEATGPEQTADVFLHLELPVWPCHETANCGAAPSDA
jgi:hypothetical protein